MEEELVSVIVTTYNRKLEILKRALESVISQTYKNIEIILVNACPENTELEKKISKLVTQTKEINYICLDKNSGACIARNKGLKFAKGKYIAYLDDDDEWVKNKIELQVKRYRDLKDRNIGIVYSSFFQINKDKRKVEKFSNKEGNIIEYLLGSNIIGGTSNPLLLKKAVDEVGGFDETFPSSQDYDLWIRICKKYEVAYIDKPLTMYYVSDDAITRSMDKRIDGWEKIIEKNKELYENDLNAYNYFLNIIARELYKNNEKSKSIQYFKKALKAKICASSNLITIVKYIIGRKF